MSAVESSNIDTTTNAESNSEDTMPTSSPLHYAEQPTTAVVTFPDDLHPSAQDGPILTRHDTEYTEYTQTTLGTTQSSVAAASVGSS